MIYFIISEWNFNRNSTIVIYTLTTCLYQEHISLCSFRFSLENIKRNFVNMVIVNGLCITMNGIHYFDGVVLIWIICPGQKIILVYLLYKVWRLRLKANYITESQRCQGYKIIWKFHFAKFNNEHFLRSKKYFNYLNRTEN